MRDKRAEDGILAECERLIRKGGRIKYNNRWWQSDELKPHEGKLAMCWQDYYGIELTVFPNGTELHFVISNAKTPRGPTCYIP